MFHGFNFIFREFENLALKVLDTFEEHTRDLVNDVLVIRYLKLVRMDCIQLAYVADCEEFVAHNVVQKALRTIWEGGFCVDKDSTKLVI